jgi:hypothetical protein
MPAGNYASDFIFDKVSVSQSVILRMPFATLECAAEPVFRLRRKQNLRSFSSIQGGNAKP